MSSKTLLRDVKIGTIYKFSMWTSGFSKGDGYLCCLVCHRKKFKCIDLFGVKLNVECIYCREKMKGLIYYALDTDVAEKEITVKV